MAHKITWTDTARNDYFGVIDYLIENWEKKTARNFKSTVNRQLKLISKMPKMYPKTDARENVRRCVVVKQVSMYYLEIEIDKEIIVIRFYDNRKDPDTLTDALNDSDL